MTDYRHPREEQVQAADLISSSSAATLETQGDHHADLPLWKHPRKSDYRTLRFKNYVTAALPPPPSSLNVLDRVYAKLGTSDPTTLFPLDGNDTLGDCTMAALAHAITTYRGILGSKDIMSKQAVVKLYLHLTGGVDSGLNELDVLNYWRSHAVSNDKILAYVAVDPKNHTHVQQAVQLFGGVYLGFQVPHNCLDEFNARKPWTPGPLTNWSRGLCVWV